MKINKAREKIDLIDSEILALANKRAQLAHEIGLEKKETARSHYVPERENRIIDRLTGDNQGPLKNRAVASIFKEVISACRSLEGELKVGYLGPEATYSHQAAIGMFGSQSVFSPFKSFRDLFEAVESSNVEYGIVPIENSNEGIVGTVLDLLADSSLNISGEYQLDISVSLLSMSGDKSRVEKIYSHPQPIGQCRRWLLGYYPAAEILEVSSTGRAAMICTEDEAAAALASPLAGQLYNLKPVYEGIEDNSDNITRFLVVSREHPAPTGNDKTSMIVSIDDKSGALCQLLQIFADNGINLTKIESRPSRKKPWEYLFYIDLKGHINDNAMGRAVKLLKEGTICYKILGSYPAVVVDA